MEHANYEIWINIHQVGVIETFAKSFKCRNPGMAAHRLALFKQAARAMAASRVKAREMMRPVVISRTT